MEHGIEDLVDKSKIDIVVQRQVNSVQDPAAFLQTVTSSRFPHISASRRWAHRLV